MTKENFTELISKVPTFEMHSPGETRAICIECSTFDIELTVILRVECKIINECGCVDAVVDGPKYDVYLNVAHDVNGDDLDGELFSDEQWEMLVDVVSNSVKFS